MIILKVTKSRVPFSLYKKQLWKTLAAMGRGVKLTPLHSLFRVKGYESTYSFETSNSVDPELQLKDTDTFYSYSKAEIIINGIPDTFQSIYATIITNKQKSLGKGSVWIIYLVIDNTIITSKYNPLVGRSYVKLPKELDHPRKGLINIQNINDNECFKWSIVRYLNIADYNPRRTTKLKKIWLKKLDLKDIKFPVKIRDIHKIGKDSSIGIGIFGYENK